MGENSICVQEKWPRCRTVITGFEPFVTCLGTYFLQRRDPIWAQARFLFLSRRDSFSARVRFHFLSPGDSIFAPVGSGFRSCRAPIRCRVASTFPSCRVPINGRVASGFLSWSRPPRFGSRRFHRPVRLFPQGECRLESNMICANACSHPSNPGDPHGGNFLVCFVVC